MGGIDKAGDVVRDDIRHVDAADQGEQAGERFAGHDRLDDRLGADLAVGNDALESLHIVAGDLQLEKEAVELRLRQRVGALKLDGVLRGEHEERQRQVVGFPQHGHAALLHGLEEGGLRFRRGAVDFVGEDDVREQWAGLEHELAAAIDLLKYGISRNIAGEEIGGELDTLVFEAQELREAFHKFGFSETRQALQQDVAAGKDAGDDQLDDLLLAEKHTVEALAEGAEVFRGFGDFGLGSIIHARRFQEKGGKRKSGGEPN